MLSIAAAPTALAARAGHARLASKPTEPGAGVNCVADSPVLREMLKQGRRGCVVHRAQHVKELMALDRLAPVRVHDGEDQADRLVFTGLGAGHDAAARNAVPVRAGAERPGWLLGRSRGVPTRRARRTEPSRGRGARRCGS